MNKAIIILSLFAIYAFVPSTLFAAEPFIVTSFNSGRNFSWHNGPASGCSAINSTIVTSPGNDPITRLNVCEGNAGVTDNLVPDGTYYMALNVGGTLLKSQVFVIENGALVQPTPTPIPVNQPPTAIAATSLDENGNIQLDGTNSYDPENNPLTYSWRIPALAKRFSGPVASLTGINSGTYAVILTVQDGTSQTTDSLLIGIPASRPKASIKMKIENIYVDKKDGSFLIKGSFDKKNALLNTILPRPSGRILFELQTGGTTVAPIYGITGESTQTLQTIEKLLKYIN